MLKWVSKEQKLTIEEQNRIDSINTAFVRLQDRFFENILILPANCLNTMEFEKHKKEFFNSVYYTISMIDLFKKYGESIPVPLKQEWINTINHTKTVYDKYIYNVNLNDDYTQKEQNRSDFKND